MNILSICPAVPAQDAKGFQVQAYYRLRHLAINHNVTVVCYGSGAIDEDRKRILIELGINVKMLPFRRIVAVFSVIKAIFDLRMPLQCALFYPSDFRNAINDSIMEVRPDLIHSTTIRVLPNIFNSDLPLILDLVDSMALNFRRRAERSSWFSRALWRFEGSRAAEYEIAHAHNSAASFVVSWLDKNEIDVSRVRVLPLGIDIERFKPGSAQSYPPKVVLTGNMAYRPNIEAALWMARNCWSKVRYVITNAEFLIVGNNPDPSVLRLTSNPSIRVTGKVHSIAEILQDVQVAVAPMQSGSGMQFKILEAMACGIPVVTTTLGLGDIQAIPGKEVLVSDSPIDFSESILSLLQSEGLRRDIGNAGLSFIRRNHTWDSINQIFENVIVSKITIPSSKHK